MMKHIVLALSLAIIPQLVKAEPILNEKDDAIQMKHGCKDRDQRQDCCRGGKDGRDGRDGRDAPYDKHEDKAQLAYFYLIPTSGNITIDDNNPILWDPNQFTVKSSDISVDPTNTANIDINKSGIYLISYTVFAAPTSEGSPDWISFELQLNSAALAGSRYTAVSNGDATQLNGEIITYIGTGSVLELVNKTGYGIAATLENEGGRQGVFASILIQRLASTVE